MLKAQCSKVYDMFDEYPAPSYKLTNQAIIKHFFQKTLFQTICYIKTQMIKDIFDQATIKQIHKN
jgi:hypothetical protein